MKGITPIIAIILLLLITVSMAGFAFVFLQRTLEQTANSAQDSLTQQQNQMGQKYSIDNIDNVNDVVTVRNIGSTTGDSSSVILYINNKNVSTGCWTPSGSWAPSAIKQCNVAPYAGAFTCPANFTLTSPSGQNDAYKC